MSYGKLFNGALLPCPFCGQTKPQQGMGFGMTEDIDTVYVRCVTCGCSGPEEVTHIKAAKAWNRRVKPSGRNSNG